MALRLDNLVVRGEINNTAKYCVHGWLQLRDQESVLHLELTGDCAADLAGRRLRFQARTVASHEDDDAMDLDGLAWEQVGPTGVMTADRWVENAKGRRQRCLYLEWFSQNGRVVLELVDPEMEFVAADAPPWDGDGDETPEESDAAMLGAPDDADDPYGLMPDDLQQQLDEEAFATDEAISSAEDTSQAIREMELMDHLIESGEGQPLGMLFDGPLRLPAPDKLDDAQAEKALKKLLAQLALYGIALHVCKHFTPREAYRLLVEEICPEEMAYPELRGTQWVQSHMTSDFCEQCNEEMNREFEEFDRRRQEHGDDDLGDEEIPF